MNARGKEDRGIEGAATADSPSQKSQGGDWRGRLPATLGPAVAGPSEEGKEDTRQTRTAPVKHRSHAGVNIELLKSPLLSLLLLSVVVGCATVPRGFPPAEGISNFDRVDHSLYRGGQPNNLGIQSLKRLGIKTIVNLRMANDLWAAEETEARANGIAYTNVPMRGLGRPTDRQVAKVLSIIETSPSPVFVHCEHGCDRTGAIVACYRIKHDQWTSKQALDEARQYGMSGWEIGMKSCVVDFDKTYNRPTTVKPAP